MQLHVTKEPIYGFTNMVAPVARIIRLELSLEERRGRVSCMVEFVVVEVNFSYNTIIGRLSLHTFKAVPST